MNVSLTPELEKFVRNKVATGTYNNASEVVREALRLLMERLPSGDPPSFETAATTIRSMEKELRSKGVTSLSIFGSVARGDTTPQSDIDVLIEVDPKSEFDLIELVWLHDRLSDQLGRPVDVIMADAIRSDMRKTVLNERKLVF